MDAGTLLFSSLLFSAVCARPGERRGFCGTIMCVCLVGREGRVCVLNDRGRVRLRFLNLHSARVVSFFFARCRAFVYAAGLFRETLKGVK